MYMLQCIGVFGELEEYNAIRKKDADIILKKNWGCRTIQSQQEYNTLNMKFQFRIILQD
jgi:hypothetical protein